MEVGKIQELDRASIKFAFGVALAVENLVEKLSLPRRSVIPIFLKGWLKDGTHVGFTKVLGRGEFYANLRSMNMAGNLKEQQEELRREQEAKEAALIAKVKGEAAPESDGKTTKGGKDGKVSGSSKEASR